MEAFQLYSTFYFAHIWLKPADLCDEFWVGPWAAISMNHIWISVPLSGPTENTRLSKQFPIICHCLVVINDSLTLMKHAPALSSFRHCSQHCAGFLFVEANYVNVTSAHYRLYQVVLSSRVIMQRVDLDLSSLTVIQRPPLPGGGNQPRFSVGGGGAWQCHRSLWYFSCHHQRSLCAGFSVWTSIGPASTLAIESLMSCGCASMNVWALCCAALSLPHTHRQVHNHIHGLYMQKSRINIPLVLYPSIVTVSSQDPAGVHLTFHNLSLGVIHPAGIQIQALYSTPSLPSLCHFSRLGVSLQALAKMSHLEKSRKHKFHKKQHILQGYFSYVVLWFITQHRSAELTLTPPPVGPTKPLFCQTAWDSWTSAVSSGKSRVYKPGPPSLHPLHRCWCWQGKQRTSRIISLCVLRGGIHNWP